MLGRYSPGGAANWTSLEGRVEEDNLLPPGGDITEFAHDVRWAKTASDGKEDNLASGEQDQGCLKLWAQRCAVGQQPWVPTLISDRLRLPSGNPESLTRVSWR